MVQLSTNSLFAVGLAVCAAVQSVAAQTSLSPGDLGQSFGTWPFTNDSAKFSLPLRVLVRPLAPYIMVNSTAPNAGAIGERYYGVAIDLWERIAKELNWTYTYYKVNYTAPGVPQDIVDAMVANKYDVAVTGLSITAARQRAVTFTLPYENLGCILLINSANVVQEPATWAVFSPLDWTAWLMIGLVLLATAMLVAVIESLRRWQPPVPAGYSILTAHPTAAQLAAQDADKYGMPKVPARGIHRRFWRATWESFLLFVQQGSLERIARTVESHLIWGAFLFFGIVVYTAYESNLAAFLTTSIVTSSLLESYDALEPGRSLAIRNSTTCGRYVLRTVIPAVNIVNVPDIATMIKYVVDGSVTAGVDDSTTLSYTATQNCDLLPVGNVFDPSSYGFILQKSSPFATTISSELVGQREQGYLDTLHAEYYRSTLTCPNRNAIINGPSGSITGTSDMLEGLTWKHFRGLLYICAVLLGISFTLFLARWIWTVVDRKKRGQTLHSTINRYGENVLQEDYTTELHEDFTREWNPRGFLTADREFGGADGGMDGGGSHDDSGNFMDRSMPRQASNIPRQASTAKMEYQQPEMSEDAVRQRRPRERSIVVDTSLQQAPRAADVVQLSGAVDQRLERLENMVEVLLGYVQK